MLNYQRVSLPPKPLKPWGQRMPCKPKPSGLSSFLLFKIYSDHFVSYLQKLDQTQMDQMAPQKTPQDDQTLSNHAHGTAPWRELTRKVWSAAFRSAGAAADVLLTGLRVLVSLIRQLDIWENIWEDEKIVESQKKMRCQQTINNSALLNHVYSSIRARRCSPKLQRRMGFLVQLGFHPLYC